MQLDRYVSFCGLACEERATELVRRVCSLSLEREPNNRFWKQFNAKAISPGGP